MNFLEKAPAGNVRLISLEREPAGNVTPISLERAAGGGGGFQCQTYSLERSPAVNVMNFLGKGTCWKCQIYFLGAPAGNVRSISLERSLAGNVRSISL